jgi:hypothetical protein
MAHSEGMMLARIMTNNGQERPCRLSNIVRNIMSALTGTIESTIINVLSLIEQMGILGRDRRTIIVAKP